MQVHARDCRTQLENTEPQHPGHWDSNNVTVLSRMTGFHVQHPWLVQCCMFWALQTRPFQEAPSPMVVHPQTSIKTASQYFKNLYLYLSTCNHIDARLSPAVNGEMANTSGGPRHRLALPMPLPWVPAHAMPLSDSMPMLPPVPYPGHGQCAGPCPCPCPLLPPPHAQAPASPLLPHVQTNASTPRPPRGPVLASVVGQHSGLVDDFMTQVGLAEGRPGGDLCECEKSIDAANCQGSSKITGLWPNPPTQ